MMNFYNDEYDSFYEKENKTDRWVSILVAIVLVLWLGFMSMAVLQGIVAPRPPLNTLQPLIAS